MLFVAVLAVALFGMGCSSIPNAAIPNTAIEFSGHSYIHFQERVTWEEAKAICERLGGHLVVIDSKEENDFIVKSLFKGASDYGGDHSRQKWIGAYENINGEFVWVFPNGKKLTDTYNNWWKLDPLPYRKGDPLYSKYVQIKAIHHEPSVALGSWTNNKWWNDENHVRLGFICEWE